MIVVSAFWLFSLFFPLKTKPCLGCLRPLRSPVPSAAASVLSTLSSVALNILVSSFQNIFCARYLNGSLLNWFTYFLQCWVKVKVISIFPYPNVHCYRRRAVPSPRPCYCCQHVPFPLLPPPPLRPSAANQSNLGFFLNVRGSVLRWLIAAEWYMTLQRYIMSTLSKHDMLVLR